MKFEDFDNNYSKNTSKLSESLPRKQKQTIAINQQSYFVEPKPQQSINLSILQQNLGNCLQIIDDEVMKGYINHLCDLPVKMPNKRIIESLQSIHFFKISELVYQKDEFSVHKLATIFHSLSNKPCTLVLMIKSDGFHNEFYLGVRSLDNRHSSGTMMQMLKQSLLGMFPGSRIGDYYDEKLHMDLENLNVGCISSVTCVADFKRDKEHINNQDFIQGLEKFVDSTYGKAFTSILIAENVSHTDLMDIKKGYENIYTQIAPFANMQLNFSSTDSQSSSSGHSSGSAYNSSYGISSGESSSTSSATANTKGFNVGYGHTDSSGINKSVSDSTSTSKGTADSTSSSVSDAHTDGTSNTVGGFIGGGVSSSVGINGNIGANLGILQAGGGINSSKGLNINGGINASHGVSKSDTHTVSNGKSHTISMSESISKTLTYGLNHSQADNINYGINENKSVTNSYSTGTQHGISYQMGETLNLMNSTTWTDTLGISQGITLQAKNMTLASINERIEKHLKRMEECESLGMWNFAAYFIGESAAETETAASTYKSVVSGTQSGIERSAIHTWTDHEKLEDISTYVKNFMHPCFVYKGFDYDKDRMVSVTPAALVSTNELAIHMGLPRHSVKGLPVIEHATFAQEVLCQEWKKDDTFELGNIYHLGMETNAKVQLDINSLTMHTFVTGSTGAGKSNAVYDLLSEILKKNLSFLVVEPAKGEYKKVFPNIRCFGTNPNIGEIIRINPFSFPKEIHVLEHIDRIVEVFNVCWPMYAAMPAVLKESIERAYISAGWNMDLSENTKVKGLYPTFDDVLAELYGFIQDSAYSEDTKGDYIGSLSTRLKSLTNGINGRIFVGNEMDLSLLFDQSAILDISRVGSIETKALIMGLIVLKLQEYRMACAQEMNVGLRHITVLEEAHNLLKKTSTEQSQDTANLQGKSVEMLTNAIAEMRTYGEGFVIVDQAPDLLDTAVIRNTNTKIALRLPEGNDRKITGASMALSEKQILEISKFPTGIAAVYQNDWQEAVLCKLPKYVTDEDINSIYHIHTQSISKKEQDDYLLHWLLKDEFTDIELECLKQHLLYTNVSAKIRKDLILNLGTKNLYFEWALADFIDKNYKFSNIFKGTEDGQWNSLKDLGEIMQNNILDEFQSFDNKEMIKILYYICRIEHEKLPDNPFIEQLRLDYLKKEMEK